MKVIRCSEKMLLLGFAGLAALGIFLRLAHLTTIGIEGCDTFFYVSIAKNWLRGHRVLGDGGFDYLRPVLFQLHSLAFQLFGLQDYSIKLLNVALDIGNVILLFGLGRAIAGNWRVPLGAAAVYLVFPKAILYARAEMAHIPTTFLVLSAVLVFVHWQRGRFRSRAASRAALFGSGLLLALAALTHEDIMFYLPSLVGLVLLHPALTERKWLWPHRKALIDAGSFCAGFGMPYLVIQHQYAIREIGKSHLSFNFGYETDHNLVMQKVIALVRNVGGISEVTSPVTLCLLMVALAALARRFYRRELPPWQLTGPVLVLVYLTGIAMCAHLYLSGDLARLLFPLTPMIFITIIIVCDEWTMATWLSTTVAAALIFAHGYYGQETLRYIIRAKPSYPRVIHDRMKALVTPDRRLLFASYSITSHRAGFKSWVYFGDNAVFMADCAKGTFEDYIRDQHIGYVYLNLENPEDYFGGCQAPSRPMDGVCYGRSGASHDASAEMKLVRSYLEVHHAREVYSDRMGGKIFSVENATKAPSPEIR